MRTYFVSDFDYTLPLPLIAQFPAQKRTDSRLLLLKNPCVHAKFPAILNEVHAGDLMIFNDTRVMNARLFGQKESGGKIECLIERVLDEHTALAHIKASHAPLIDSNIILENVLRARIIARAEDLFKLQFSNPESLFELLKKYGHVPLPPYITRNVDAADLERYQTIYAKNLGAIAAPTAGLHFDEMLLEKLRAKNIDMGFVTLHVGAGTFQPVRTDDLSKHIMHSEIVMVSKELCKQIKKCRERGGRVIAVGTTVVRSLETAALSGELKTLFGDTNIFITPGFKFNVVDILITNFHLPKSTLLMLVCAFAGFDRVMQAYAEAVEQQYRFFSYGDAMVLERS